MKKIGSILTRNDNKKVLQQIYIQYQCKDMLEKYLTKLELPSEPLDVLTRKNNNDINIFISSSNKLLLTFLKTHQTQLQEYYQQKLPEKNSWKSCTIQLHFT